MNWSIVNMKSLQRYRLCRFGLGCPFLTHHCPKYTTLNWIPLTVRCHIHWLYFTLKCMNFNYPSYLKQYLVHFTSNDQVRHSAQLYFAIPHANKIIGKRACKFKSPSEWNDLPHHIRSISSSNVFKHSFSIYFKTVCTYCKWSCHRLFCT